jgi:hypothetical protein
VEGVIGQHPDASVGRDRLLERRQQRAVELDREDLGAGPGERDREGPEPSPDLEDAVTEPDARVARDRAREVRIDQEMLAERLRRDDPVPAGEPSERGRPGGVRT